MISREFERVTHSRRATARSPSRSESIEPVVVDRLTSNSRDQQLTRHTDEVKFHLNLNYTVSRLNKRKKNRGNPKHVATLRPLECVCV